MEDRRDVQQKMADTTVVQSTSLALCASADSIFCCQRIMNATCDKFVELIGKCETMEDVHHLLKVFRADNDGST